MRYVIKQVVDAMKDAVSSDPRESFSRRNFIVNESERKQVSLVVSDAVVIQPSNLQ